MKKRLSLLLLFAFAVVLGASAQSKATVDAHLKAYFRAYEAPDSRIGRCKLVRSEVLTSSKTLNVYVTAPFGEQPFRPETVETICDDIRAAMPAPVNNYRVNIYVDNVLIDNLIPNGYRSKKDPARQWTKREDSRTVTPWVQNTSRPYAVTDGLQGRHLAINASHGTYFHIPDREWIWQRPPLFCSREDIITQSIVYPFLIPMLENAGAVVFTTRERDINPHEVIVDDDIHPNDGGLYVEEHGKNSNWTDAPTGIYAPDGALTDGVNPFFGGRARCIATSKGDITAVATWTPRIPAAGRYAVYVTYPVLPGSVDDAHYIVTHKGGTTTFTVNQQMGGGTWVYLGTFAFDEGMSEQGMVALTNESRQGGVVAADAVRFGGGMGSVARGLTPDSLFLSGRARYLEGARYWSQYAGFPYEDYANKQGQNDYAEDINARSYVGNRLMGGSVYCPDSTGRGVPLELAFALHTDAGINVDGIVGTLGICTTNFHDGLLGDGRLSRFTSRDMVDEVMTSVARDLRLTVDTAWTRRGIWDRNYSESRISDVPSMILELLAHQNFNDMRYLHDPQFKFITARAIYKGLLRHVAVTHGNTYTVQPLPPERLMLVPKGSDHRHLRLSWQPREDALEPTARPTGYVVYTRMDDGDFDNGRLVRDTHLDVDIAPGHLCSYRVTAVNKGGESFPSETLAAGTPDTPLGTVLFINGFCRTSGPAVINTADSVGFDLLRDPGVPYVSTTEYCGVQTDFNPASRLLGPDGSTLGTSGDELIGQTLVGNTFDYAAVHGRASMDAGYAFASVSRDAFCEGAADPAPYTAVDLCLGLENDHPLPEAMYQRLSTYAVNGGSLLVSGSCIGTASLSDEGTRLFLRDILRASFIRANRNVSDNAVSGQNLNLPFSRSFNPDVYPLVAPEVMTPVAASDTNFPLFVYDGTRLPAAVASATPSGRTALLAFPFEAVGTPATRSDAMRILLGWLTAR